MRVLIKDNNYQPRKTLKGISGRSNFECQTQDMRPVGQFAFCALVDAQCQHPAVANCTHRAKREHNRFYDPLPGQQRELAHSAVSGVTEHVFPAVFVISDWRCTNPAEY